MWRPHFFYVMIVIVVPLALEVWRFIAFLIISSPLMLNYCHKSLFCVTKIGEWGDGIMITHHLFLIKFTVHKPLSYLDLFTTSANE